ncbi:hypothetical protein HXX01_01875 [Candidatus Nomurabacteria bacterium]|nr:hypothetical protein [Candidatus Nomurabacteria bacterium]
MKRETKEQKANREAKEAQQGYREKLKQLKDGIQPTPNPIEGLIAGLKGIANESSQITNGG